MTYEQLKERYKKVQKWGYSMRDNAHRLYKELNNELQNNKELMCELLDLKSKSCDGCKYDEKDDTYPSICWECSRYYADRYEPKDKQ